MPLPKHTPSPDKTLFLCTLGCPKNQVDSEILLGSLQSEGWHFVRNAEQARVILVNTCAFIGPAKEESVDKILELAQHKKQGRCETLVVLGCLAQRYGEVLAKEMPEVDYFLGTSSATQLAPLLAQKDKRQERLHVREPLFLQNAQTPRVNTLSPYSAYLKIAEGCDNACSFCIIPKLRGPLRSRSIADLLGEAERLLNEGVKELILVAQDTTAYGMDLPGKPKLETLLAQLSQLPFAWIRLLYAYPRVLTPSFVRLMADTPNIARYMDMPTQHASDTLLRAMRRGRDSAFLKTMLAELREAIPNLVLRTSVIVGFPGESEEDFQTLLRFIEEIRFERLGAFVYSDEEGTASFLLPNKVPSKTKNQRHKKLMLAQQRIHKTHNQQLVGQTLPVLVEGRSEESEHLLVGRHEGQAPEIDGLVYINDGEAKVGDICPVRIGQAFEYDLLGCAQRERAP
ncbi:MAG: 30S ribosomal protein S12 methylthiotransferase RimO [Proteobacteria bacterium]|nr:30S ribosomal protein S12 methylthiotransferase RimO [Cystobacterineae bacterium]MCL2258770.1 30S ribosomal protein S12 methylthiotransferase RimO [Cystobacterineae bacterium]MCL2314397.1 30S ribosomal protein S12 methylthiotransferase RimO [Pseudomonadota bacterium]